ncbi:hypothetical protein H696_02479 [Fonticula alba]|uniref:Uncharacterized protein n=1 Tax=Fonticula alba TaxID=691883 RepID=A0A058ZC82_FONAL|nr:hypothetical protein H696_02479 [Fonticula alba]KCV71543.1 hypothetical protein H696_02479 [Fonticula alba]|eukprot:XP_009494666.1 hypothetical protein H696_02479 [Fonticula alba]
MNFFQVKKSHQIDQSVKECFQRLFEKVQVAEFPLRGQPGTWRSQISRRSLWAPVPGVLTNLERLDDIVFSSHSYFVGLVEYLQKLSERESSYSQSHQRSQKLQAGWPSDLSNDVNVFFDGFHSQMTQIAQIHLLKHQHIQREVNLIGDLDELIQDVSDLRGELPWMLEYLITCQENFLQALDRLDRSMQAVGQCYSRSESSCERHENALNMNIQYNAAQESRLQADTQLERGIYEGNVVIDPQAATGDQVLAVRSSGSGTGATEDLQQLSSTLAAGSPLFRETPETKVELFFSANGTPPVATADSLGRSASGTLAFPRAEANPMVASDAPLAMPSSTNTSTMSLLSGLLNQSTFGMLDRIRFDRPAELRSSTSSTGSAASIISTSALGASDGLDTGEIPVDQEFLAGMAPQYIADIRDGKLTLDADPWIARILVKNKYIELQNAEILLNKFLKSLLHEWHRIQLFLTERLVSIIRMLSMNFLPAPANFHQIPFNVDELFGNPLFFRTPSFSAIPIPDVKQVHVAQSSIAHYRTSSSSNNKRCRVYLTRYKNCAFLHIGEESMPTGGNQLDLSSLHATLPIFKGNFKMSVNKLTHELELSVNVTRRYGFMSLGLTSGGSGPFIKSVTLAMSVFHLETFYIDLLPYTTDP